jgi:hypothetical protein
MLHSRVKSPSCLVRASSCCLRLGVTLGIVTGGCASSEADGEPSIGELLGEYYQTLDAQRYWLCGCFIEWGYVVDVELCWAELGGPTIPPPILACMVEAVEGIEEARSTLECHLTEAQIIYQCSLQQGCLDESTACLESLAPEILGEGDLCPGFPHALQAAITDACYGYTLPPDFVCDDGEVISYTLQCNGQDNCVGGEDELDC